jgi:hypothetical protein
VKRLLSVLSAAVFLFTMSLPVMARQRFAQAHHSSSAATAKSENSPKSKNSLHEAVSSTKKATVRHARNGSHHTNKTQKKG